MFLNGIVEDETCVQDLLLTRERKRDSKNEQKVEGKVDGFSERRV